MNIEVKPAAMQEIMKGRDSCWACTVAWTLDVPAIGESVLIRTPGNKPRLVTRVGEKMFHCTEATDNDASAQRD